MAELFVGLVHYPIYNKRMQVIASAVTNFDIHDISRTCRTYDVKRYYIIHPLEVQKNIIRKIIGYWQDGYGKIYNPDRADALERVCWQESIAAAAEDIEQRTGKRPYIVTTDARIYPNTVSYSFMRRQLHEGDKPILLLFGTGFGIEAEVMKSFDYILEPVYGSCDYNHLCVRSAAAIILDRLAGEAWWQKE
ncbi:RNA methyltransferase [uncultured Phascolarctobacterium sp.]|mgnify:FL=1|uniref:RNA methyltransferase n=1 Tax=uncultured Phascolarctobacterium sp. TaxID=512296 RepID=UPI002624A657|nr:RNA methyltransferase [uncultured Phascolarctobacterium sp.]